MPDAPLFPALLSRNHSNPCAVGTPWLLKGHFFDGDLQMFYFCCVSLCSVLYNIFIIPFFFFKKTSVNAQPLSPPFFEEIAAHRKDLLFSHFCVCVCVFLLFHIYVDFRVPLADALGQIRSILDRCWCHFLSTFPAFSAARAELLQRLRKKLRKKLAENLQRTSKQLTRNKKCKEFAEN